MARKRKEDYFDALVNLVEYSCKAAKLLYEILNQYNPDEIEKKMEEMHAIEHDADIERHLIMKKLAREFITPIEREDIMAMADVIDNVTDSIEDVFIRIYMFNISKIRTDGIRLSELIVQCCDALKLALIEFRNFKKPEKIQNRIIAVNHLQEVGNKLFMQSTRRLYLTCKDPIELGAWEQTLHYLKKCCDACEDVADVIEDVIMKNS